MQIMNNEPCNLKNREVGLVQQWLHSCLKHSDDLLSTTQIQNLRLPLKKDTFQLF